MRYDNDLPLTSRNSSVIYPQDPLPQYRPKILPPLPTPLHDIEYNYRGTADRMSGTICNPMGRIPYEDLVRDPMPTINYNSMSHVQYGNMIMDPCGHMIAEMGPGGLVQAPPSIPAPVNYITGLRGW
jgi:hypothetical protein